MSRLIRSKGLRAPIQPAEVERLVVDVANDGFTLDNISYRLKDHRCTLFLFELQAAKDEIVRGKDLTAKHGLTRPDRVAGALREELRRKLPEHYWKADPQDGIVQSGAHSGGGYWLELPEPMTPE